MLQDSQNNLMIMINNDTFISMIDVCKATKLSLFKVCINNYGEILKIYSTDTIMSHICIYTENHIDMNEIFTFYFTKESISAIDSTIKIHGDFQIKEEMLVSSITNTVLVINQLSLGREYYYISSIFDSKIQNLQNIINYNIINSIYNDYNDITNDDSIISLLGMKVADNIIAYIKDKYYMTIYKGFIPIAKSDKVYLKVFPIIHDNLNAFISNFTIRKKKNIILDFYYMYLYT